MILHITGDIWATYGRHTWATPGRHLGDTWATPRRHLGDTWATHGRLMCDTWATHVQHMCNTCATHVRHMCDTCATHGRHMGDTPGVCVGGPRRDKVWCRNALYTVISDVLSVLWNKSMFSVLSLTMFLIAAL